MECSTWWYSSNPLPGHIQKKAQNVPLQQSIPSVVSFNVSHCLPWRVTLAMSLDMSTELCFGSLRLRVCSQAEIKRYKSRIRIIITHCSLKHCNSITCIKTWTVHAHCVCALTVTCTGGTRSGPLKFFYLKVHWCVSILHTTFGTLFSHTTLLHRLS